jgi:hypothetical protein
MSHPEGPQDWTGEPGPAYGGSWQSYGAGQGAYGAPAAPAPPSSKAITALVLGIASLVVCCLGPLLGVPAIIVGLSARKEVRTSEGRTGGDGLALGGIIAGALGSLLGIAVWALLVGLLAFGSSIDGVHCQETQAGQDQGPRISCS